MDKPDADHQEQLLDWLRMSTGGVLDTFTRLPGAGDCGSGDTRCVYVPGGRRDRVLLVAHADTLFPNPQVELQDGFIRSTNPEAGIGADDRAGCCILWLLKGLGHSLLVTNSEEHGQLGAKALMEDADMARELNRHCFALAFDRKGHRDLVFYEVGSSDFANWCGDWFTGFQEAPGSVTDICEICDSVCGVNVSVGFYNEHTPDEFLHYGAWRNTLTIAQRVLGRPNLPRFRR